MIVTRQKDVWFAREAEFHLSLTREEFLRLLSRGALDLDWHRDAWRKELAPELEARDG